MTSSHSDSLKTDKARTRQFLDAHVYKLLATSAIGAVLIATVVYRAIEGWSWVDSLYFSTVAITTVGFGDITPTTDGSKLFTILYIVSGITLFTTFLNARLQVRAQRVAQRQAGQGSNDD